MTEKQFNDEASKVYSSVRDWLKRTSRPFSSISCDDTVGVGKNLVICWIVLGEEYLEALEFGLVTPRIKEIKEIIMEHLDRYSNQAFVENMSRDHFEFSTRALYCYPELYEYYIETQSEKKYSIKLI